MTSEKKCSLCDWAETNEDTPAIGYKLNLMMANGEKGVFCSNLRKVVKKQGGKYCKSYIKKR